MTNPFLYYYKTVDTKLLCRQCGEHFIANVNTEPVTMFDGYFCSYSCMAKWKYAIDCELRIMAGADDSGADDRQKAKSQLKLKRMIFDLQNQSWNTWELVQCHWI